MSLFCAGLIKKMGVKRLMLLSALCSLAGNLIIFVYPEYFMIFAGLILDGVGVGLITNSVYVMISRIKDEDDRTAGLSVYNSAYLSGINFGMMTGSLLAVNMGRQEVFVIVSAVWAALIVITLPLIRRVGAVIKDSDKDESGSASSPLTIRRYVADKKVLGFMVFIQNPYIIFSSFVFYYVPLFCDMKGYGEALCSLFIMIYSQMAILLSGSLTSYASKIKRGGSMYAALGLNIAAVVIYAVFQNLPAMISALIILGVSAAFGKPVQQNYYLNIDMTKKYGEDRAMGIYNFSENIGESLGPTVFGKMISAGSMRLSLMIFCGSAGVMGLLHKIICGRDKKEK